MENLKYKPEEKSNYMIDENFDLELFEFCDDKNNDKRMELFVESQKN